MKWIRIILIGVLVIVAMSGVGSAQPFEENPACDSPSQGFVKSTAASGGTSLANAGFGVENARKNIGCNEVTPGG